METTDLIITEISVILIVSLLTKLYFYKRSKLKFNPILKFSDDKIITGGNKRLNKSDI